MIFQNKIFYLLSDSELLIFIEINVPFIYRSSLIVGVLFAVFLFGYEHPKDQKEGQMLFNDQDLSGWDTYLGPEWIQTSDSIFEK